MNNTKDKKILIIEDEINIITLMTRILKKSGYQVYSSINYKEAIKILEKEKIYLVIMDLNLPDISGIELFDAIKNIAPNVKVLIVSGMSKKEDFLERAEGFLRKPYSNETLLRKVDSIFQI